MFFCGDVAVSGRYDNLNFQFDFADGQQALFLNLEGAFCTQSTASLLVEKRRVFNIDRVIELLQKNHTTGCILANNHITDFDDQGLTLKTLDQAGIRYTGYGLNAKEAARPLHFMEDGTAYSLLAFGWNVTGCRYAGRQKRGVNAMKAEQVITQIRREKEKGNTVIAVFHWNYTYELYPMPAQRELAKLAVEAGASFIIGCHPHCIQGIEYYRGVPIVYSLGNWMFDNDVYFSGRLSTEKSGLDELVVEYKDKKLYCHWYKFDTDRSVPVPVGLEEAQTSSRIRNITPFAGMEDKQYIKWFKKNRKIHKFLPVFSSNKYKIRNKIYEAYIFFRDRVLRKVRDKFRCILRR